MRLNQDDHDEMLKLELLVEKVSQLNETVARMDERLKSMSLDRETIVERLNRHSTRVEELDKRLTTRVQELDKRQHLWMGGIAVIAFLAPWIANAVMKSLGY